MRIYKPETKNPITGTLHHRINGKYVNAEVPNAGPFYFRFKRPDGTYCCQSLGTEDRREAVLMANGIILALDQNNAYKDSRKTTIEEIWDIYEAHDMNISEASMDDYKQIFRRWAKKLPDSLEYAEDVTMEMCRDYATEVAGAKSTGMRDIRVLRGIWNLVFPTEENPWNTGIKPKVKQRQAGKQSRALTLEEARRFRKAILQEADEWPTKDKLTRSKVLTRDLLLELYDAVTFAWYYGMRVGSLCSLNWKDFERPDWFYHIPPKTEKRIVAPLTLPIMPEIDEIIRRRRADSTSEWIFPHLHAQYTKRGTVVEREHSYEMKRSANRTGQAELARDIKQLFKKAGIEDDRTGRASMHGFRKSCTTNLTNSNTEHNLICSITGWSNKDMVDLYSRGQAMQLKREALGKSIPHLGNGEPVSAGVEENVGKRVA